MTAVLRPHDWDRLWPPSCGAVCPAMRLPWLGQGALPAGRVDMDEPLPRFDTVFDGVPLGTYAERIGQPPFPKSIPGPLTQITARTSVNVSPEEVLETQPGEAPPSPTRVRESVHARQGKPSTPFKLFNAVVSTQREVQYIAGSLSVKDVEFCDEAAKPITLESPKSLPPSNDHRTLPMVSTACSALVSAHRMSSRPGRITLPVDWDEEAVVSHYASRRSNAKISTGRYLTSIPFDGCWEDTPQLHLQDSSYGPASRWKFLQRASPFAAVATMTRIDELSAKLSATTPVTIVVPTATAAPESGVAVVSQAEAQSKSIKEAAQTTLKETLGKLNALQPAPASPPGPDPIPDSASAQAASAVRIPARVPVKHLVTANASPLVSVSEPAVAPPFVAKASSLQQDVQAAKSKAALVPKDVSQGFASKATLAPHAEVSTSKASSAVAQAPTVPKSPKRKPDGESTGKETGVSSGERAGSLTGASCTASASASSSALASTSPSLPCRSISSERVLELKGKLAKALTQVDALRKSPADKDFRNEVVKTANTQITQISANRRSVNQGISGLQACLDRLTKDTNEDRRAFVRYRVAYRMVDECEVGIRSQSTGRAAWPLAYVATRIFEKHKDVEDLFFGDLYTKCPYAAADFSGAGVGRVGLVPGQREREAYSEFVARMVGYMRLSIGVHVVRRDLAPVWTWLARALGEQCADAPIVTTLLHTALEMAGVDCSKHYGRQFKKLVGYVEDVYMPQIVALRSRISGEEMSYLRASEVRIGNWLAEFRQRGAPKAEGRELEEKESELQEEG